MPYRLTAKILVFLLVLLSGARYACAQPSLNDREKSYRVSGGSIKALDAGQAAREYDRMMGDSTGMASDSTKMTADSLAADREGGMQLSDSTLMVSGSDVIYGDSVVHAGDTVYTAGGGMLIAPGAGMIVEAEGVQQARADSVHVRHNWLFRDSIPISRLTLYSMVLPGVSQLYNGQAWKVPVLYATLGTTLFLGIKQNQKYQYYKNQYNFLNTRPSSDGVTQTEMDPWQRNMIRHNTYRQIFFAGAIASYIYFVSDGVVNYPGAMTDVKKATTLSTVCPGAGQVYNGKFWKLPIVVGGFATFAYTIDWNNRGYQRFKEAYNRVAAGDTDFDLGRYSADFLKNLKNNYRRNRDLCIILTGVFYIINIIDAHVDAHLKDYDISDDLALNVYPFVDTFLASGKNSYTFGLNFNIRF